MPKVFRYCPVCGNKLQKKDLGVLQCVSCSFRLYPNPKPTTAVIIRNEKGEILFIERARDPKKGFLDLPGGFIEYDETAEESACREVEEELGLKISPQDLRYVASGTGIYTYQDFDNHTLCLGFELIKPVSLKDIKIEQSEISRISFISFSFLDFKRIAFDDIREILNKMLQKIEYS